MSPELPLQISYTTYFFPHRQDRSYPGHPQKAPHINPYTGEERHLIKPTPMTTLYTPLEWDPCFTRVTLHIV